METYPVDPRAIPLEQAFPHLKPEEREEMRNFLEGYCEVAWQVWERLERERAARDVPKFLKIRKVVDIVKIEHKKDGT